MVRPFMAPVNSSVSVGAHLGRGRASCWWGRRRPRSSEQMKVRSSTRATSAGSERAQVAVRALGLGRAGERARRRPARWHSRSYSSAEPSHQWIASGCSMAAHSSTQSLSRWLLVVAVMSALPRGVGCGHGLAPGRSLFGGRARTQIAIGPCRRRRSAAVRIGLAGGPHVDLGAQAETGGPAGVVEVEHDPLALAQHAEDRAGSASAARSYSERSVSRTTTPSPVPGS